MNRVRQSSATADDLDEAVGGARRRFVERHPESRRWAGEARAVLAGGNSRSSLDVEPFPIRIARAEGAALWDVDGIRYVDLLGDPLKLSAAAIERDAKHTVDQFFIVFGATGRPKVRSL